MTVAGGVALAVVAVLVDALVTPASAYGAPGLRGEPRTASGEPVIVRLEPGSDPDARAREAALRGASVRFVYHDVFPGCAAVLPPGGLRGIEGGPGVVAVDPDTSVRLSAAAGGPGRRGGSTASTSGTSRSRRAARRRPRTRTAAASPPT